MLFTRYEYKHIKKISKKVRRGQVAVTRQYKVVISGTETLRQTADRDEFITWLITNHLDNTKHKPHPYVIRLDLIPDFSRLVWDYSQRNNRQVLRNTAAYHMNMLVQGLKQRCLANPELQWRVLWYSVGVSLHTKQVYALLAFRHMDPMHDILLQGR